MKVSDSHWHRQLTELSATDGDEDEDPVLAVAV